MNFDKLQGCRSFEWRMSIVGAGIWCGTRANHQSTAVPADTAGSAAHQARPPCLSGHHKPPTGRASRQGAGRAARHSYTVCTCAAKFQMSSKQNEVVSHLVGNVKINSKLLKRDIIKHDSLVRDVFIERIVALLPRCSSVCLPGTSVHCDHVVHFSMNISSWLDSPMFWTPWHQSMSPYSQPFFSISTWNRGGVWMCRLCLDVNTNIDK